MTQYTSDPNIIKIVRGMKQGEKSSTQIKRDAYLDTLKQTSEYYQTVQSLPSTQLLTLDIDIQRVYEIDDLFSDGLFMKTVLVKGLYQDRASTNSQIQVDF